MAPLEQRGDLSSTGYALATPGKEYLVLQPSETGDPFIVTLEPGTYTVEWFSVNSRETAEAGNMTVEIPTSVGFSVPFEPAGPSVLYLRNVTA